MADVPISETSPHRPFQALPLVRAHLPTLPHALQRIGKYVLENPDLVVSQTAHQLGLVTSSGPASIVRFCRAIGFTGLQEFRLALAGDLAAQRFAISEENDDTPASRRITDALAERAIRGVRETQSIMDQGAVERLADALLAARRIDVYGAAVSGLVGQHLAFRLLRVGLPAHAIVDSTYAAYVANGLGPDCVAIAITESGMTEITVEALSRAKAAGAKTAVVTHRQDGPIVKHADEVLLTAAVDSPVTGTKSVIAFTNLIAIEVLASVLTLKLGLPDDAATD
ncbi:MAG: MurR/RpiR family transcriptional regulator [Hyphomicrobiales bacterium]|nr:MurR/RpiR family transcriptional regulator [Hyphomicrobiales bacterium]